MKRFLLLLMLCVLSIGVSGQTVSEMNRVSTLIEQKIKVCESEIKTAQLQLKINKNDGETNAIIALKKSEIKNLKECQKQVKATMKSVKQMEKISKDYDKSKSEFDKQIYLYKKIEEFINQ